MPGSGKSTVGVLLAKALGYSFIDTDLIISRKAGKPLQRILDEDGLNYFLSLEDKVGKALECNHTVIATGGSMVLSDSAMEHLKSIGTVVFIDVPLGEIRRRVTNITTRGIAFHRHETLDDVYRARKPLYEKYAEITVKAEGGGIEQTVSDVINAVTKK